MNHMIAQRRRSQGYSLMELMIVVVITGVLAALAIPTFGSYVQKSRTSEATQFLGVIKLKQEGYRAEFGTYLVCRGAKDIGDIPSTYTPGDAGKMKNAASFEFTGAQIQCFNDLGAKPDGPVRFGYGWAAGTPGEMSAAIKNALNLQDTDVDHYFVAHATADLDGDGKAVVFELTNFTKNVFIMDDADAPLAAGWE